MEQVYLFDDEEWRDIEGYEGLYQVSNKGRVRSLNYRRKNLIHVLRKQKGTRGLKTVTIKLLKN